MQSFKNGYKAFLAAGFILAFLAIVIAADYGWLPTILYSLYRFPGGDKVGHFLLMGLLAFFVNMAMPARFASRGLVLATLVVAILVTIEEASQSLFRTRTLSMADLLSSYVGIVVFAYLAWRLRQRTMT